MPLAPQEFLGDPARQPGLQLVAAELRLGRDEPNREARRRARRRARMRRFAPFFAAWLLILALAAAVTMWLEPHVPRPLLYRVVVAGVAAPLALPLWYLSRRRRPPQPPLALL